MLIFYVNLDIWTFIEYVQDLVGIYTCQRDPEHIQQTSKLIKKINIQANVESDISVHIDLCQLKTVLSAFKEKVKQSYFPNDKRLFITVIFEHCQGTGHSVGA